MWNVIETLGASTIADNNGSVKRIWLFSKMAFHVENQRFAKWAFHVEKPPSTWKKGFSREKSTTFVKYYSTLMLAISCFKVKSTFTGTQHQVSFFFTNFKGLSSTKTYSSICITNGNHPPTLQLSECGGMGGGGFFLSFFLETKTVALEVKNL